MEANSDPTYPLFPVFALFTFFLVLIPLPLHIQAWNAGTCAFIFWVAVPCFLEFVNAVVWRNNVLNPSPVWCDISSKILVGASVGIPAAGLCISRRLYVISSIKTTVKTYQDKRRALILDSCIAFGIPAVVMVLHHVVQGHRFDILEGVGCWPSIYDTILAYFLVFMWPTLLGCISFVLSALTLGAFYRRRMEFNQFLSAHSSLSMSRYIRLMLLALSEMLCTIPISIYSAYIANKGVQMQPWVSWAVTHYDFSYVGQIPAAVWITDPNFRLSVEMTRWVFPASGILFFLLFGLGSEARKKYCATASHIATFFRRKPASEVPTHMSEKWKSGFNRHISAGSLPIYAPAAAHVKHNHSQVPRGFDIDVEMAAGCSSPSLPSYSSEDQYPSPTATCTGGVDDSGDAAATVTGQFTARDCFTVPVPAYHRPFSLPTVYPALYHTSQEPRSSNIVCNTIHSHGSTAL